MAVKASATISLYRIKEVTNTTNYYLLQSSTANPPAKPTTDNPGGNWSTTEPTYTEGSTNTLYTVIKTKYSDGSFEYTPVSKSTSYEAAKAAYNKAANAQNTINNLQIGGRNYISNLSKNWEPGHWSMTNGTAESWNNRIRLKDPIEVIPGSTLAIKVYQNDTVVRNLGFRTYKEDDTFVGSQTGIQNQLIYTVPNSVHRIRCFIYEDSPDTSILDDEKIKIKIEFGNKYTDYTPSPEDVNDRIDDQIDNISIGGRNLALGTKIGVTTNAADGTNKCTNLYYFSDYALKVFVEKLPSSVTVTTSFDWVSNINTGTFKIQCAAVYYPDLSETITLSDNNMSGHSVKTTKMSRSDVTSLFDRIQLRKDNAPGNITVTNFKIEFGNKDTDWTPAPEDTEASVAEVIVGTQTAATASWVGKASFDSLVDKQQIAYWLPVASAANATLNLTLSDGTTTGAIPLYYQGTTRLGTHYPAGSVVHLTYRENVTIGSTTIAKGWWGDANYNTNDNTYDRIKFANNIVVKTAISADRLIVGDNSGYFHFAAGVTFNIDKPILLAKTAKAAGATDCSNNYLSMPSVNLQNNVSGFTGTENSTVYIVGILNGNNFVVDSSTPLTTTVPTSDDGKYYISLGYIYRNANHSMYLYPEHPIYKYVNGQFKNLSQVAYEAQYNVSNIRVGTRNLMQYKYIKLYTSNSNHSIDTSDYIENSVFEFSRKAVNNEGFYADDYRLLEGNKKYVLRFFAKTLEGEITTIHMYHGMNSINDVLYFDGVELGQCRTGEPIYNIDMSDGLYHEVMVKFETPETPGKSGNYTGHIVQFDKTVSSSAYKVSIKGLKLEEGTIPTDWTLAPEDERAIVKSDTSPSNTNSVWFNTNDSMFYVYDNNSDSPTYQTWVIINDISGSFEEINRKFNQDIPNNIAQAIANNNIELANVYYTKEQVDAQLEIKDGEIKQTFNDWVTRVENTANGVNEIVTDLSGYINTGTKDGSTYLELGNRSSDFKVKIENSRMAILYKNQEVTKWEQDIFEVETVISKLLHLGKFGFIVNDDDSISFRKIDQ